VKDVEPACLGVRRPRPGDVPEHWPSRDSILSPRIASGVGAKQRSIEEAHDSSLVFLRSGDDSAGVITGDVTHLVIVQTNPGYSPNPGNAGTGTIVAQFC
jgi:hypothetical protein